MGELLRKTITGDSKDIDRIQELCNASFPAEEVPCSIREFVGIADSTGFLSVYGYYDNEQLIAFMIQANMEDFDYGLLVAVDPSLRSGGYGSKIMDAIKKYENGKPFMFVIEKPDENTENNEQRLRRQAFYQKNGMFISKEEAFENGVTYLLVSTVENLPVKEYLERYLAKALPILNDYLKEHRR